MFWELNGDILLEQYGSVISEYLTIKLISKAFECRNTIQYYVDRVVQKYDSDLIILKAPFFHSKSKEILGKLNENQIKEIRDKLSKYLL